MSGWIGVDFDGTLAKYDGWKGAGVLGEPVGDMLFRVKKWLADGKEVRIFTARAYPLGLVSADERLPEPIAEHGLLSNPREESLVAVRAIRGWCLEHVGRVLTVTCIKDYGMTELYDDRAVQVEANTGVIVGYSTRGSGV